MLNFSLNAKKRTSINATQEKQKLLIQQQQKRMEQLQQQKRMEQIQQIKSETVKKPIFYIDSNVSVENNVCEDTTVITYLIGENNVEDVIPEPNLEEPVIESLTYTVAEIDKPLETIPEVETEVAPEVVAEVAPEVVAEVVPEVVAEVVHEVVAEVVPEVVAEVVPEVVAEVAPEVAEGEDVVAESEEVVTEVTTEDVNNTPKGEKGKKKRGGRK